VDNEWIHIIVFLEVLLSDSFGCVIFATKERTIYIKQQREYMSC
jgi:hypothetical protein